MKRKMLLLFVGLGLCANAWAQNPAWHALPDTAPRLAAFVHPPGVNPDDVGLLLVCENGGFVPMFRLGPNPALEGLDRVWIETLHSDQLAAGNYWQYDPVRNRALPLADINGVIVAQALFEGGTLRVRVSRSNGDPDVAIYNFGLDQFAAIRQQVPCLLATASPTYIDRWHYDESNQAVLGGDSDRTAIAFYCHGPNEPAMVIQFGPAVDPQLNWMVAFIAVVTPDGAFRFQRTAEGQYYGNANPMVRTLMHLTQDPPFPLVMLGSPAPFAMLALGNIIEVIGNLPCVMLTRG